MCDMEHAYSVVANQLRREIGILVWEAMDPIQEIEVNIDSALVSNQLRIVIIKSNKHSK